MADDVTADSVLAALWHATDADPAHLDHLTIEGTDPHYPSSFRVGTMAAASIGGVALAAAALWRARIGRWQQAHVSMRHAAAAFRSERYLRIDGAPPPDPWDPFSGYYRTGDGRWVQLNTNFPHHARACPQSHRPRRHTDDRPGRGRARDSQVERTGRGGRPRRGGWVRLSRADA